MIKEITLDFFRNKNMPIRYLLSDNGNESKNTFKFIFTNNIMVADFIKNMFKNIKTLYSNEPVNLEDITKDIPISLVQITFIVNNETYLYQFRLSEQLNKIDMEILEKIHPQKQTIIKREDDVLDETIFGDYFSYDEKRRLALYAYDLKHDKKKLLVSHLSTRYLDIDTGESIFNKITNIINNIEIVEDTFIKFGDFSEEGLKKTILLLEKTDIYARGTNVGKLKEIDLSILRLKLGRFLYDYFITELVNYREKYHEDNLIVKIHNQIYVIKYNQSDFTIYDIYINDDLINEKNQYLIDLVYNTTYVLSKKTPTIFFINDFLGKISLPKTNILIHHLKIFLIELGHIITTTTTNEKILDSKSLERSEFGFITKEINDGVISYRELRDYRIRSDKVLSKGYLEGIFH